MKIAALYARVSSQKQQRNENIASQLAALHDYALKHDLQVVPQHVFQDDGYSGATLDRPALDRLRDAVAQGEVEAVLILSPDRLARQFAYQFIVVEEFECAGCEVVFSSHGFGSSPADRMLVEMTGVFAEYERALITERCRRGRLYRARQGQLWMKEAPYGYTYLPKTESAPSRLVVNEAEAEVVRLIFRWLVDEQLSTYQINKRLNESGIRTRRGRERWAGGYLINLLRNPVYAGTYYYNRRQHRPAVRKNMPKEEPRRHPRHSSQSWRPQQEWIGVSVPAIIDQETWELARRQLQLNKERAPRNNKKHDYLLKGLLVCGDCQLRMLGHAGNPSTRRRRYLCSRKETLHPGPHYCPNRTILAETIEDLVWQSVSDLLRDPELLTAQYRAQEDGEGTPEQHERRRLERRQVALEREAERLLDAYQSGVIELSDLKDRRERLKDERAKLVERLAALRQRQCEREQQAAFAATVEEFCHTMSEALTDPSFETKQKILRLVVDRVEFKGDEITIKHLIPVPTVQLQRHQHSPGTPLRPIRVFILSNSS